MYVEDSLGHRIGKKPNDISCYRNLCEKTLKAASHFYPLPHPLTPPPCFEGVRVSQFSFGLRGRAKTKGYVALETKLSKDHTLKGGLRGKSGRKFIFTSCYHSDSCCKVDCIFGSKSYTDNAISELDIKLDITVNNR
ncbi:unnamed protein product [Arctogadus glacialis]